MRLFQTVPYLITLKLRFLHKTKEHTLKKGSFPGEQQLVQAFDHITMTSRTRYDLT